MSRRKMLVDAYQRDRLAGRTGAAGAADAVDVVLGDVRQLEVDDVRQLVDVDAARRDVGRDEHLQVAALEFGQRPRARALALVAVDRHRGDVVLEQMLDEAIGAMLHAREDEHLVPVVVLDEMDQQVLLHLAADRMHLLRDRFRGLVAARDLDQHRRIQETVGDRLDLVAEGRRKQQALLFRRQHREHLLDVVDEAHVEHAIGLVEHEDLDVREVERALAVVVEEPPRRGDEDVDAAAQLVDLRLHADAAEHHHAGELGVLAVGANAFLDLRRELARRREDEGADRQLPRASRTAGLAMSRCSIGSTKPAVLPVPVWAPPMTSPPERTAGIACAWIGVGVV